MHLLNFLEHPKEETLKNNFTIVKRSDTQAAFTISGEETSEDLLFNIQNICQKNITENLIVPQDMGPNCAMIRHRVMRFEIDGQDLVVKYVTLGEFNNFDAAMNDLASLYPQV